MGQRSYVVEVLNDVQVTIHAVETSDGWCLQMHHLMPEVLRYPWPVLCIHGFSQNHRAWLDGGFAQGLAAMGLAVYVLDLRGHGGSTWHLGHHDDAWSTDWRIDDYLVLDLEAAVAWVRARHHQVRVVLCGHSMGGVLAVARGIWKGDAEVAGLIALAAPFDPRYSTRRVHLAAATVLRIYERLQRHGRRWDKLPMDRLFRAMDWAFFGFPTKPARWLPLVARVDRHQWVPRLWHPRSTEEKVVRSILQQADPESMSVVAQLAGWFREGQIHFRQPRRLVLLAEARKLSMPVLAAWGDQDMLAPIRTGDALMRTLHGKQHRRLLLRETNHIDITAGRSGQEVLEAVATWLPGLGVAQPHDKASSIPTAIQAENEAT